MTKLVLIRGLPGSGKSTLAKLLHGFVHLEADMYFMRSGQYCYDASKISDAHGWCLFKAGQAISQRRNVVVSNVFARICEMDPYIELAARYGIQTNIVEAKGNFENVHHVPEDKIQLMKERWEVYNET